MKLIATILVSLALTSCSIPIDFYLFNNTKNSISLTIKGESYKLFRYKISRIKAVESASFTIRTLDYSWSYDINDVPLTDVAWHGWGPFSHRVFYVQLKSDGSIWATTEDPLVTRSPQPKGFPIRPST